MPEHLPRAEIVHAPACVCPRCGGALRPLGEDVTEVLDYVPARFRVIRHRRPKLSCRALEAVVQAPMLSRPIERGIAGPGLLAHVLVAKYADPLPLYRQAEIYAREGLDLDRSTLADWVGRTAALFLGATKLHADDTPVPVLAPGTGRTRTGRLWVYVRDDRPAGSETPPAALYRYTPDRKGERPAAPERLQRRAPGRRLRGLRPALRRRPHCGGRLRTCGASSTTSTPPTPRRLQRNILQGVAQPRH